MIVLAETLESSWNSCMVDGVPTLGCLDVVMGNLLTMASAFVVLLLFIMFVYGGFQYLSSFGNADKVKKAQGTLKLALLGFILYVSAFLILKIIDIMFLGGKGALFRFNLNNP
ncbi:MAG: hypothetical protein ACPLRN_03240 [Microgenomates group bacterium]